MAESGASQVALVVKNSPAHAGDGRDTGSIPGLGRSPGGGNPLQDSCLENPIDRGAWRATIYSTIQSQTWLKQLTIHTCGWDVHAWIYPRLPAFVTAQNRTHSEAASEAPQRLWRWERWPKVRHWQLNSLPSPESCLGSRDASSSVLSQPLPTGLAFLSHTKNAKTLTQRGPGRSLPDVIQLPIKRPHGVPFSTHYLVATATVEFSFRFDTLGLHHLIRGETVKHGCFQMNLFMKQNRFTDTENWPVAARHGGWVELAVWS